MSQIDRAKLNAIRANCDLIESLEGDDQLLIVAYRALYNLAGGALSSFAQSVLKNGGKLPPKDAKLPTKQK